MTHLTWVRWDDASYERGEKEPKEFIGKAKLETAGLWAAEDDETISLALDREVGEETFRHIAHIPKKLILKRRDFRFGPKERR